MASNANFASRYAGSGGGTVWMVPGCAIRIKEATVEVGTGAAASLLVTVEPHGHPDCHVKYAGPLTYRLVAASIDGGALQLRFEGCANAKNRAVFRGRIGDSTITGRYTFFWRSADAWSAVPDEVPQTLQQEESLPGQVRAQCRPWRKAGRIH
jgi:hypothetical protein